MSQVPRRNEKSSLWTSKDAEDFKKLADTFSSKVTSSPIASRKYLEQLGTHTPKGKLTKRYGG